MSIDSLLYRQLSPGTEYDNLIPASSCKRTFLGTGDTYFSMDGIKDNILKNYRQTEKLAPKLKRNSTEATATAIYNFLYRHIQYHADGADQNLRSPACSWKQRKEGIDCKSFSIFAGAILMNLKMKFYIRKVKQPLMMPDEWTHVYIVVPKDQKTGSLSKGYVVIDATKHTNTEGQFSQKHDIFMDGLKHYGLQAPAPAATQHGPVAQYNALIERLANSEVRPAITAAIHAHLQQSLNARTTDSVFIHPQGIIIEGRAYDFLNQYNEPVILHGISGLNGPLDGLQNFFKNTFRDIKTGIFNKFGGWISSLISKLTCMGASQSASPRGVSEFGDNLKNWVNSQITAIEGLPADPNEVKTIKAPFLGNINLSFPAALNGLIRQLNTLKAHQAFHKDESRASCTKQGNQAKVDLTQHALDFIENAINTKLTQYYNVSKTSQTYTASDESVPSQVDSTNWKGQTRTATTNVYTFSIKPGVTNPSTSMGGYTGGSTTPGNLPGTGNTGSGSNTGSTGTGSTSTNTGTTKPPTTSTPIVKNPSIKPKKASMNPLLIAGIAGAGLLMMKKGKGLSAPAQSKKRKKAKAKSNKR